MIKLRFTTSDSFVSKGIRLFTWSDWSHVEIEIPWQGYLGAHMDGGVLLRPFNYDKESRCVFGYVDCPPEVSNDVLRYALAEDGKPYDLAGIIGISTHRDWQEKDKWFCSELVAFAFNQAGYPLVSTRKNKNRITPADIFYSPLVDLKLPPSFIEDQE